MDAAKIVVAERQRDHVLVILEVLREGRWLLGARESQLFRRVAPCHPASTAPDARLRTSGFKRTHYLFVSGLDKPGAMSLSPRSSFQHCSGGGTGRHTCLRCMCRKACRFESCPEHQNPAGKSEAANGASEYWLGRGRKTHARLRKASNRTRCRSAPGATPRACGHLRGTLWWAP
jgi:hypothetical protein